MQTRNTFRALMICVMAMAMLVVAPTASQAKHRRHHGASPDRVCARAANSADLTADQKAAVAAACTQFQAAVDAAHSAFGDAVDAARAEVGQARDAVHAACADGQGDTQACHDARDAARAARRQARKEVHAARKQLKADLLDAARAFEAAVKAALAPPSGGDNTGGDQGGGDQTGGDSTGGDGGEHHGATCADYVSYAPADKQAALQAACDQLVADTTAARSAFEAARQAAISTYLDASAAMHSACDGQDDSQACTDARAAFEQALAQIHADLEAAEAKLRSDLAAAEAAFRSTLETVFAGG